MKGFVKIELWLNEMGIVAPLACRAEAFRMLRDLMALMGIF